MKKIILSMAMLADGGSNSHSTGKQWWADTKPSAYFRRTLSRYEPCHTNGACLLPYGLDVTFDKTVHLIFPSAIRYVDLGSQNIIAGKSEDAENVLRVKASVKDFETETNMSVICEDGSFYAST